MAKRGISTIVVGVDGSEHAGYAVQWAIRMAHGMGSEIVAVYALDFPVWIASVAGAVPPQLDPEWRRQLQREFEDDWCKPLKEAAVRYRAVMEDGPAAAVIRKVADDVNADLIIMGRRGRGELAELVLGSVSHALVLQSHRPVLIISSAPNALP